jgi:hypothetical protein
VKTLNILFIDRKMGQATPSFLEQVNENFAPLGGDMAQHFMSDFKVDESIEAPKMSDEEKALAAKLEKQIDFLAKNNAAMLPALYEMLGYQMVSGELSKIAWDTVYARMDPVERGRVDAIMGSQEQLNRAIRGEVDFSPGLERDIAKFERVSGEETRRQLGSNFLRSSAGPAAFSDIKSFGVRERERARGAAIDRFGNLSNMLQAQRSASKGQAFASLAGLYKPEAVLQGYGQAQQPYQYYAGLGLTADQLKLQAEMYNISQAQAMGKGMYTGMGGGSSIGVGQYKASSGQMS